MSNIRNTQEFKNHGTFCFRINGISIYWKDRYASKDAYRFVNVGDGQQLGTPSENLLQAVAQACQTPNPLTVKFIEKLTSLQKKKLKIALSEHDCNEKIDDLPDYGIDI